MGASCQVAKDGGSTIGIVHLIVSVDYPIVEVATLLVVGFVGPVAKIVVRSLTVSMVELPILVVCA